MFVVLQEEQQKLRGTIDRADEMIRSLDECISQLESGLWTRVQFRTSAETPLTSLFCPSTELAEIEEKGSEEKPSLKTLQEGDIYFYFFNHYFSDLFFLIPFHFDHFLFVCFMFKKNWRRSLKLWLKMKGEFNKMKSYFGFFIFFLVLMLVYLFMF